MRVFGIGSFFSGPKEPAEFFNNEDSNRKQYDNNDGGGVEILFDNSACLFAEEVEKQGLTAEPHRPENRANSDKFEQ